mgnify:CR=1 FL=1
MIEMNRRTAMGWSLAAAATGLASTVSAKSPKEPFFKGTGLPVGLQLFTLGDALRSDLEGQLAGRNQDDGLDVLSPRIAASDDG